MKWLLLFFFLFFINIYPVAQPTGNTGIYFNLYDVSEADTFRLSEKIAKKSFIKKAAFKTANYIIQDKGEKQYGFSKMKYDSFPCKEYFWYEENRISITRNRKDIMNIHFANLPVNNYFINIRFQPGDYELVFPKQTPVWKVAQLFPQKWEADRNYGYDITPVNWNQFKRTGNEKIDTILHSIIPAAAPAFPYQSSWTGTCFRSKIIPSMNNRHSQTNFLVRCQINNGRLTYIQNDTAENSITMFEGEMIALNDSAYRFRFRSGYFFGNIGTTAANSCFIITNPSTSKRIKGIRFFSKGIYSDIKMAATTGCSDECCITNDTIPAALETKVALMYQVKQGVYQTQFIKIPERGRKISFIYNDWQQSNNMPSLTFNLSKNKLYLVNAKGLWKDVLELTRDEN